MEAARVRGVTRDIPRRSRCDVCMYSLFTEVRGHRDAVDHFGGVRTCDCCGSFFVLLFLRAVFEPFRALYTGMVCSRAALILVLGIVLFCDGLRVVGSCRSCLHVEIARYRILSLISGPSLSVCFGVWVAHARCTPILICLFTGCGAV